MFLTVGSLNHHVHLAGPADAPALVLLHSLGTSHALWQAQSEALSATHRIIAPDFRGHGLTEVTDAPLTCEMLAEDVLALLEAIGVRDCHVAGISLGGVVAQILAARIGNWCQGLALFDTYIKAANPQMWRDRAAKVRADGLPAIADGVRTVWMRDADAHTPDGRGLQAMLRQCSDAGYADACDALARADCTATTPSLTMPALVAYGAEDKAAPRRDAETLARALRADPAIEIPDAGHLPLLHQAAFCTSLLRRIL